MDAQTLWQPWGVLSEISSCNRLPVQWVHIKTLYKYGCFSDSGTSQLTFIPLVNNISLLTDNVQDQVDEGCGGGIHCISFLLTVKTGRNKRWSHQLKTLRMRKSVSLKISKLKVILEWEERERVNYSTSWDNKMRTSSIGIIKCWHFLQTPTICHLHLCGGHYHILFSFYLQFKSHGLPAVISKSGLSLFSVYPFLREGRDYYFALLHKGWCLTL